MSTAVCVSEFKVGNVTVVSFVGAATVLVVMSKSLCVEDMAVDVETNVDVIKMMSYIMRKER